MLIKAYNLRKYFTSMVIQTCLFVTVLQSCSNETYDVQVNESCSFLESHCYNSPHLDDLKGYVLSAASGCQAALRCLLDYYEGECNYLIRETVECLAASSTEEDCVTCDEIFVKIDKGCNIPNVCKQE